MVEARWVRLLFSSLACALLFACNNGGDVHALHPDAGLGACPDGGTTVVCVGTLATTCVAGVAHGLLDCATSGNVCVEGLGCRACMPHAETCEGETLGVCRADGSGLDVITTCDPATTGQHCTDMGCIDLCARAAADRSYVGCEYFAVPTLNPELQAEFSFAVAIANPNLVAAEVTVTQGLSRIAATTVAPGAVETLVLPWVPALREDRSASVIARGAAYRIVANVPVIVDQFNPLEFRLNHDCAGELGAGASDHVCYSYTNDASLLLPAAALTGSYVAISRPTLFTHETIPSLSLDDYYVAPGFITIIGADDAPVTVTVLAHGHIAASTTPGSMDGGVPDGGTLDPTDGSVPDGGIMPDGSVPDGGALDGGAPGPLAVIPALAPGESTTFTLAKGDVVQLVGTSPLDCPTTLEREPMSTMEQTVGYCQLGNDYDLTGTEIRATGRVAVISGHSCDFVPFDRWACDHLEEQMFPFETWDTDAVVSITKQLRGEPNLVRVVSGADDNVVSFDPASIHAPITLQRFEYEEVVAPTDVRVSGTGPISVAQFLVGQDYAGLGASGAGAVGDPSMGLAVPVSQERSDYTFLVPTTYTTSYINVTAEAAAHLVLDGHPLGGFTPIGSSGLTTARIQLRGGVHHATGDRPFALLVYGYASFTSYLYTGGLNFRVINPPI